MNATQSRFRRVSPPRLNSPAPRRAIPESNSLATSREKPTKSRPLKLALGLSLASVALAGCDIPVPPASGPYGIESVNLVSKPDSSGQLNLAGSVEHGTVTLNEAGDLLSVNPNGSIYKNGRYQRRYDSPNQVRFNERGDYLVLESDGDVYKNGSYQRRVDMPAQVQLNDRGDVLILESDGDIYKNGGYHHHADMPAQARLNNQGDVVVLESDGDVYKNGRYQHRVDATGQIQLNDQGDYLIVDADGDVFKNGRRQ